MSELRLSKSRYLSGAQCHLRLWYETHRPDLEMEPDDVLQAVFDTGHEVGRTACWLYPSGHAVSHNVDDGLNPRLFAFLGARALGRDVADGFLSPVN